MNFLTYLNDYVRARSPLYFLPIWRGIPMGKTFWYPEQLDLELSTFRVLHHEDLKQTRIGAQRSGKSLAYAAHFDAKLFKMRTVVAHDVDYTWKAYRMLCEQARERERKRLGQLYHSSLRPRTLPPSFNLLLTRTDIGDIDFDHRLTLIVVSLRYHWANLGVAETAHAQR